VQTFEEKDEVGASGEEGFRWSSHPKMNLAALK